MTNVAGKVTGRTMPGRMSGMADRVLQNPRSTMATPKTGLLPTQTLSKMGTLSRGGLGGLVLAGGLGLFEIGRQTGFEPEKLGQAAAQVQKSLQEVANEAADVARELGQPIQDFVNRVVAGYQSEMGESDRLERMMMGGQGRTISDMDRDRVRIDIPRAFDEIRDMDIQERNLMQQEQLGFAAGDEVDVDALPKGLKAMYDSGPKGREGVEKIAAKTDKFAEGDEAIKEQKPFTEFQPEGSLKGTFFDFVPDAMQVSRFLMDRFGSEAAESESIRERFNKAFAEARAEGKEVFMFMGKPYNTMTLEEVEGMALGGPVENEIDEALSEIQSVQPEAMVIQQVMTMVMEMIQSGASEEQIMQALMEMGLDQEDIQQVMMMVAEEMAGQESIDGQLAQMM
jgi:Ca2+-binding EF-hand superfamily protein